ncbi:Threonyl/alanyl tRNA synthetase, partial [Piptocephalis cylindrospora]
VGNLACQRDSHLYTLDTQVILCEPLGSESNLWRVELADTVLFPEGGGQPCDTGSIEGIPVVRVERQGNRCLHYCKGGPLVPEQQVRVQVDVPRRTDLMQQHSAQHLLSALLKKRCSLETTSWKLGEETSYIQLDGPLSPEQMRLVEEEANSFILQDIQVTTHSFHPEKDQEAFEGIGRMNRPEDAQDQRVRVVEIHDLDRNPCCGTHVRRLGQLGSTSLLRTEPYRGGTCRVHFVAGTRVQHYLRTLEDRDQAITKALEVPGPDHLDRITQLKAQTKEGRKSRKLALEEAALV